MLGMSPTQPPAFRVALTGKQVPLIGRICLLNIIGIGPVPWPPLGAVDLTTYMPHQFEHRSSVMKSTSRLPRGKLAQILPVVVAIVIVGLATPLWQWYRWATSGDSPYAEIGIDLNAYMPGPLHDWACNRIAQRFPGALPPYGCTPSRPG